MGLAKGEDLREVVIASRKHFVERAVEDMGMSESQAQKEADKLIGVTWDVGHINMLRKYGADDDKIIEQTMPISLFHYTNITYVFLAYMCTTKYKMCALDFFKSCDTLYSIQIWSALERALSFNKNNECGG